MPEIPSEVQKTVLRLQKEGNEKLRLADELLRNYSGDDPRQSISPELDSLAIALSNYSATPVFSTDALVSHIKNQLPKSTRVSDLAKHFRVTTEQIKKAAEGSGGRLTIPDWRGWITLKHK